MTQTPYLEPTQESGRSFVMRKIPGEIVIQLQTAALTTPPA